MPVAAERKAKIGEVEPRRLISMEIRTPDGWQRIVGVEHGHRTLILQLQDGSEWQVGLWKTVELREALSE